MENTLYAEIMRNSSIRQRAVLDLIQTIQLKSNRLFSEKDVKLLQDVLKNYEVEDGVSVFMTKAKPEGKEKIAKIRFHNEYVTLWWGKNKYARKMSNPNKYALGLTFSDIPITEHTYITIEELNKKFPDFKEFFATLHSNDEFKLFAYSKASFFSKAVMEQEGTWLLQTPEGKNFVPSAPIGKKIGDELHIYWPKNKIKNDCFKKLIFVID